MELNCVNKIYSHKYIPIKCYLKELVYFQRGKNITAQEMQQGEIPVVSAGTSFSGYHNKFNVKGPSITISSSGANAGLVLFHNYNIWAADCLFSKKSTNLIFAKHFLRYLQPVITNLQIGAAQPHVYSKDVNSLKVEIPPTTIQNKINSILEPFDLAVENNLRMIDTLEEIIKCIYSKRFIRFRYPGNESINNARKIPDKWEYVKFSEYFNIIRGISYSSEEINCEDGINLVNLKNIKSYGGFNRVGIKKYNGKYNKRQIVKFKDLVMGVTDMTQERRTVGHVALIPTIEGVISADLIKLESKNDNIFNYCLLKYGNYSLLFSQFGNGANVIHLRPDAIKNQKILVPNKELIALFVKTVEPMFEQIETLYQQNDLLEKMRDKLLPRLMSGKLEVL